MEGFLRAQRTWRFPKIRGTFLGVLIIRMIVIGGLYLSPPIFQETTTCTYYTIV